MRGERTADADVLVVGSINADLVVEVQSRPAGGETVLGSDVVTLAGGKGANQAVAAARCGATVALLAQVGNDRYGELAVAELRAADVDTSLVAEVPGVPTGIALITVTPDGENAIVVSPGANARVTPADVEAARDRFAAARVVVAQLELPLPTVRRAVEVAVASGARVVVNCAPPMELPFEMLRLVDPLVTNEHEAAVLLGAAGRSTVDAHASAVRLLERGPRSAVVTLGAEGAAWADSSGHGSVAAAAVDVVDTTGAGDAFVGALAAALARGETLAAATAAGVRAGTAAVATRGAR